LTADAGQTIPHIQPIRVLEGRRDALRAHLLSQSIETGLHYMPNHLLSLFGGGRDSLPVTENLYRELLSLPLHPGLEASDIDRVCDSICLFFSKNHTQ
jgi:dTDP-4-amino-4,6-dideoxygalactose transaminase